MRIDSTRFGSFEAHEGELLRVPAGLVGLAVYTEYAVLQSDHHPDVLWLQSVREAGLSLPIAPASALVSGYRPAVAAEDLEGLHCSSLDELDVFLVLNRVDGQLTANCCGPLLVHPALMLGRQVVLPEAGCELRRPVTLRGVAEPGN